LPTIETTLPYKNHLGTLITKIFFMQFLFLALICLVSFSCQHKPVDLEMEEKSIRRMLQTERKAHFDRNVDLFINEFSDSMLSVNKGIVMKATPQERREKINGYFRSIEFIKWDDVAEPIIRFSDDGSLAYAVIQKQVIVSYPDSLGKKIIDTSDFAWASIYRKQKGEWKVECNISTSKTP
jgi:hypothetical protein